jgi:DNA-binding beta-propeller fold protein YncE
MLSPSTPKTISYVGYNSHDGYAGQVKRYRPGAKEGIELIPDDTVHFLTGVAIDQHGALLVANELGGAIDVFTAKRQPPSRVIKTGQAHPFMFAFDRHENVIYVSDPCFSGGSVLRLTSSSCNGAGRPNTVVAIAYPSGKRLWTLRAKNLTPMGVAIRPNAAF